MRRSLLVVPALLLAALGAACGKSGPPATPGAGAPGAGAPGAAAALARPPTPVEAEVITTSDLVREVTAVGTLRSNESTTISSEINGRIAQIGFEEGKPVEAGALLFQLDDAVWSAELQQARADLTLARRNDERAQRVFAQQQLSQADRDQTRARLDAANAAFALAQARHGKTRIIAPFAGIAGLRQVSPGDYVEAGAALVNLESVQPMKVDFRLSELALSHVAAGQQLRIEVDAWPGEAFAGEVFAVDPRVETTNRSIGVRAQIPNVDGRLRPGLFARVKLQVAHNASAVTVAEQAIVPQGEKLFVYVIEDGKAALRPVRVGMRRQGRAEIIEGLQAGETVIVAGVQKIGPGAAVQAVNLPPATPLPAPATGATPAPGAAAAPTPP